MGTKKGQSPEMDGEKKTRSSLHISSPQWCREKPWPQTPAQTTDVSHKLSGCFTSRVGFFSDRDTCRSSQSQSTRAPCQTPCQTLQVLMLLCFFGKITIRKDHSSLTSKPPWFNADIGLFKQNVPFSEIKNCNLVWQMTENWALRIKSFVVDPENISSAILYLNLITQSNVRLQILVSSLISPRLHL